MTCRSWECQQVCALPRARDPLSPNRPRRWALPEVPRLSLRKVRALELSFQIDNRALVARQPLSDLFFCEVCEGASGSFRQSGKLGADRVCVGDSQQLAIDQQHRFLHTLLHAA